MLVMVEVAAVLAVILYLLNILQLPALNVVHTEENEGILFLGSYVSQRGGHQSPDHPQHRKGQGEEPEATSKMILGLVQSKMPGRFFKIPTL